MLRRKWYSRLAKYAEAIEEFRKAIGSDKDFMDAYYNYGMAIIRLHENNDPGRVSDAIEQYKSAIKDDPRLAGGYFLSGIANFNINNSREAIEDFEQYDRGEKSADFYNYWGNALLQLANNDAPNNIEADKLRIEAISKYKKAAAIDPNYLPAYYNQSIAYAILGERRRNRGPDETLLTKAGEYYQRSKGLGKQDERKEDRNGLSAEVFRKTATLSLQPPPESDGPVLPYSDVLPWVAGLAALLTGLLAIFVKRNRDASTSGAEDTTTPPAGPAITPAIDDASVPGGKHSATQRRTQVGEYVPPPRPPRPAVVLRCVSGAMQNRQFRVEQEVINIGANSQKGADLF